MVFEDVQPLCSPQFGEINTISELEKFIREHIHDYWSRMHKQTEQGTIVIYLENETDEITITGETVILSGGGESFSFAYAIQGNALCLVIPMKFQYTISFSVLARSVMRSN